ncbi:MAG: hypothetical protein H6986_13070 [Pseudomonadales bacterium]|nr:hypothetical protein [Pseudomonadales bacterium]
MHSHTLAPGLPVLSLIFQLFLVSAATAATPDTRWLDARQIEYRITGEYDGQFLLDATGDAHACAHA